MARDHQPENSWTVAQLNPQSTDHILEIGFGAGVAIQMLLPLLPQGHIAGVDYSKTMLRVAHRRNAQAVKQGQVDLRYSEATTLPFAEASFDKVFGIHTLYFWPRPRQVLASIWRVLKPGGMVDRLLCFF